MKERKKVLLLSLAIICAAIITVLIVFGPATMDTYNLRHKEEMIIQTVSESRNPNYLYQYEARKGINTVIFLSDSVFAMGDTIVMGKKPAAFF